MNDSESDPYESGQNSERSDISDDNDSHQETELHDNSDVISLEAESDGERFDPTEGENSHFQRSQFHPVLKVTV